jgi:hypothetical protein
MAIAPFLLEGAKQFKEITKRRTCIWGLMNYVHLGTELIADAFILGDINCLLKNGLVETAFINWEHARDNENHPGLIITVSELLYNLIYLIINQKIIPTSELISDKIVV